MPPRKAASSFSLSPPIGSTRPRSVISPVIARLALTGILVSTETIEVTMATPAEGPSFGVAPSGTWTWMSTLSKVGGMMPSASRARAHVALCRLHQLLHDVAELARGRHAPLAGQGDRLDRQQFAADLGPGEAGADPDQVLVLRLAVAELAHPGVGFEIAPRDPDPLLVLEQDLLGRLADQVGELALEIAHPGLARVVADQIGQRVRRQRPLVGLDPVRLQLLGIRWRRAISIFSSSV